MRKNKITLVSTLFALTATCDVSIAQEYIHYNVKKRDRLISILRSLKLSPIFGKQGYLNEAIALNPINIKRKGNLILPNTVLVLPIKPINKAITNENNSSKENTPEIVNNISPFIPPQEIAEKKSFKQYSFFKLGPQFSWVAINSVNNVRFGGTDVSNLTSPAPGFVAEWRIMIRPESSLFAYSSISFLSFYKDPEFQLSNTNFTRTAFGLGYEFAINSSSKLATILQVNQNYFSDVISPKNIQIQSLTQTEIKTQFNKELFKIDRVHADWGIGGILILPSTREQYKATTGYGYNLDLRSRFLSKEIGIGFTHKFFKVNETTNQTKEIFANLNFQIGHEE